MRGRPEVFCFELLKCESSHFTCFRTEPRCNQKQSRRIQDLLTEVPFRIFETPDRRRWLKKEILSLTPFQEDCRVKPPKEIIEDRIVGGVLHRLPGHSYDSSEIIRVQPQFS